MGNIRSNFDLSSSLLAQTNWLKKFLSNFFQKVGAVWSAQLHIRSFLFHSFSLGLFFQRKAAKKSWYLRIVPQTIATAHLLSTFSLRKQPQRKSSQKEKGVFSPARRAVTFLRKSNQKTFLIVRSVLTQCSLNPNLATYVTRTDYCARAKLHLNAGSGCGLFSTIIYFLKKHLTNSKSVL